MTSKRIATSLFAAALALAPASGAFAAEVQIINADPAGVGLNDPTAAAPVGGNTGTTRGQQRLNVLLRAAQIWADNLISAVPIVIRAQTASQFCDATSAVLASAGANAINRDFAGAPFAGTWYHGALANAIAGVDLQPGVHDIQTQFNLNLDNDPACLGGAGWYYGFDHNEGNQSDLLATMLHEYGHGLGFANFVNEQTGTLNAGFPDVYSTFTRDLETDEDWNPMTNAERQASAINDPDVVWTGPNVTAAVPVFLDNVSIVTVNSPPAIAGVLEAQPAAFGPPVPSAGLTDTVILAVDGGGVSVNDGCEAISNGGAISGNIALIDRGNCNFNVKVANAQAVGAVAVLIGNNQAGLPPMGGADPTITIPSVGITQAAATAIKGQTPSPGVSVTLGYDPANFAGTKEGFLRLNAPNPLVAGSQISHWTPAANPSLLMEPAITPALTDDVDLTLEQFKDIGWTLSLLFKDGFESGCFLAWDVVQNNTPCTN